MDFDDLEEAAESFGPSPTVRRAELLDSTRVEPAPVPLAEGRCFGARGAMKILWMHGGGTNDRCSQAQFQNVFQHAAVGGSESKWRDLLEPHYFCGPHSVPREWHRAPDMQELMRAYEPNFWLYYEFSPEIERGGVNHQREDWVGFDETMEKP